MAEKRPNIVINKNSILPDTPIDGAFCLVTSVPIAVGTGYFDTEQELVASSLSEAEDLGITNAKDSSFDVSLWYTVKRFFEYAKPGTKLYIKVYSQTDGTFTNVFSTDKEATKTYIRENNDIQVIGVLFNPDTEDTDNLPLPADLSGSLNFIQTFVLDMETEGIFIDNVMCGVRRSKGVTVDQIGTENRPNVSLIAYSDSLDGLTGTINQHSPDLGSALGRLAYVEIGQSLGRTTYPLNRLIYEPISFSGKAQTSGGVLLSEITPSTLDTWLTNGFIHTQQYVGLNGHFITIGKTLGTEGSSLSRIEVNRACNKTARLGTQQLLKYVNAKVRKNADETIFLQDALIIERDIINAITSNMIDVPIPEITDISVVVSKTEKIGITGKLVVTLKVTPLAGIEAIEFDITI